MADFVAELTALIGPAMGLAHADTVVVPMNTGAEAVETAIKASRKWAHKVKGVPDGHAEIIACRSAGAVA